MRWIKPKTFIWVLVGAVSLGLAGFAVGCTRVSNGTFWVREAPLPEGWPELTPVGEVEVKDYPATRSAIVGQSPQTEIEGAGASNGDVSPAADASTAPQTADTTNTTEAPADGKDMDSMFMTLFKHIKSNEIAMTAPVDMGYRDKSEAEETDEPAMASMAFLYRRPDQGTEGADGDVTVINQPGRLYVSIGVRGGYTDKHFAENLATLDAWLEDNAGTWAPDGPPRYLGYNSPFVPGFMRYGEVQRPVRRIDEP